MEKELTLRDADESILVLTTTNLLLVPTEVVLEHLPRNEVRVSFLVWIRLRQFFAVTQKSPNVPHVLIYALRRFRVRFHSSFK